MLAAIATMASSALPPSPRMARPASAAAACGAADDAAAMSGGVQVGHAAALASRKPRFFNSASAVGIRPRNAT